MSEPTGPARVHRPLWLRLCSPRSSCCSMRRSSAGRLLLQTTRRNIVWRGFTLDNYGRAWNNAALIEAFTNSLVDRAHRHRHLHRHRRHGGARAVALPLSRQGRLEGFMALPIVIPEICMGVSLLMFFAGSAGRPACPGRSTCRHHHRPRGLLLPLRRRRGARADGGFNRQLEEARRIWAPANGRPSGMSSCPS